MQQFLGVLSAIGFVLLIILIVVLIFAALILFLPVVYRARLLKNGKVDGSVAVRWLFGAVSFRFLYREGEPDWTLRIFGFPLHKVLKKKPATPKKKADYQPAKKQPTIPPGQVQKEPGKERGADSSARIPPVRKEAAEETEGASGGEFAETSSKEQGWTKKIGFTLRSIYDKLGKAKDGAAILRKIGPDVRKLLKAVSPRKIAGRIDFGFEDPAHTGMLLGFLGAACIPVPETLKVNPDFQNKKLECDVKASGRVMIILLLIYAVRILKEPEIRKLLGQGRHRKDTKK